MDYEKARREMIDGQLRRRRIVDERVLAAMFEVPRHRFVPEAQRRRAYDDGPLPLGPDQTISQPYIVALMCQLARVEPGDRVLEVGTGSGYQAAVLAALGTEVFTIERDARLAMQAAADLAVAGYESVKVRTGDGREGWPEAAPFAAILVTAAPEAVPGALPEQLAEGGRLVVPVGAQDQVLLRLTRRGDELHEERSIPVRFVPLR